MLSGEIRPVRPEGRVPRYLCRSDSSANAYFEEHYLSGPCTTGIPACVFRGLGDGDFHFWQPASAEVCPVGRVPDLPKFGFVWHSLSARPPELTPKNNM